MLLENWILNLQDLQPHANLFLPLISPDQLQQTPRPPFTVVRQNCQNLFSKIVTSFNPQLCHGNLCLDSLRFKYRTELDSRCSLYHWEIFMSNVLWQSVTTVVLDISLFCPRMFCCDVVFQDLSKCYTGLGILDLLQFLFTRFPSSSNHSLPSLERFWRLLQRWCRGSWKLHGRLHLQAISLKI